MKNKITFSTLDDGYIRAAEYIIKRFFNTYSGVKKWIKSQGDKAVMDGIVVSPFFAKRHLIECEASKNLHDKKIKHFQNVACNSPIQNHEAAIMSLVLIETMEEIKKRNLQTQIVGMIHDSIVLYIKYEELKEINIILNNSIQKDRKENNGVPLLGELNYADTTKDEVWGFGRSLE